MTKATKNTDVSGTKPEEHASVEASPAEQGSPAHEASGSKPLWYRTMNRVQCSIWPQHNGKTRYSIKIFRSYLDRRNNQWKRVSSYDPADLKDVRSLSNEAEAEILRLEGMTQVAGED